MADTEWRFFEGK